MIIMRPKDPDISLLLLPYYVEDLEGERREDIGAMVYKKMTENPNDICVLAAIDRELCLHGFAIAFKRESDVFIGQAYNDGKLTRDEVDGMFGSIIGWAKANGFNRVAATPNRHPKLWHRRWGFDFDGQEVYREI